MLKASEILMAKVESACFGDFEGDFEEGSEEILEDGSEIRP